MRQKITEEIRNECRRLRLEDRLSVGDIASILKISKAAAALIVKDLPLTADEYAKRRSFLIGHPRAPRGDESPYFKVIKDRIKTTDQKGAIAEAAAIFRLKVWGFVPHIPLCAGGKSDIAVWIPDTNKLVRVQVKCVRRGSSGSPYGSLRARAGGKLGVRYAETDFDFFVGYDPREDICYVYSTSELKTKHHITMRRTEAEKWDKLLMAG